MDALAELKAVGCAFVSLRDNLDLTMLAGRLCFTLLARWPSLNVSLFAECVKAGLAHARSKGQKLGRPKVRRNEETRTLKIISSGMRADGDSYGESLGTADRTIILNIYPVCMTL